MEINITVLGSGSSGNSVLITYGDFGFLIDAGFSRKELFARLDQCSISPEIIKAIIITHEHGDHVKGARVIADTLDIPTFATYFTSEYLFNRNKIGKKRNIFQSGSSFKLSDFLIKPFSISHDAIDPVGFVISIKNTSIGYAMDLGYLDTLSKCRLKGCNTLILETNHDVKLLSNSNRPFHLKRRILSNRGHLSNDVSINALEELITEETDKVLLGHISSECNNTELVRTMAEAKLSNIKRKDIDLSLMKQNKPLQPILIG
ncbi:MAG TPA: MBL fold metallo-hydrolase [Victivallales bacterium]|nr:MBL fold metallo-hydrolase [Victivallales bacterium]